MNMENLRKKLLADVYSGGFSGIGAMLLDEDKIRNATDDELRELAKQYGYDTE